VVLFREIFDRGFRTGAQIEEVVGIKCIACLPDLKEEKLSPNRVAEKVVPTVPRRLIHSKDSLRYVVNLPFSQFTEGLRSLKITMDLNGLLKPNTVIGVTSTLPEEGKSTIASNFAYLVAHSGRRAILIDCDLRNTSLTQRFAADVEVGLIEVVAGKTELFDAVWIDQETGLNFLPTASASRLVHTEEILASSAMKALFDHLRETFDFVIVDLPPLAPVVDTRATSNLIDSYVYVVEWGQTNRNLVERTLREAPEIYDRLLGIILNKTNMVMMSHYDGYGNIPGRYSFPRRSS
jgi:succinoglycan biosynthesis transport protein ExoP